MCEIILHEKEWQHFCFTSEGAASDLKGELQQVLGDGQDTRERHLLCVAIICIDDTRLILTNLQDHSTVPLTVSFRQDKKNRVFESMYGLWAPLESLWNVHKCIFKMSNICWLLFIDDETVYLQYEKKEKTVNNVHKLYQICNICQSSIFCWSFDFKTSKKALIPAFETGQKRLYLHSCSKRLSLYYPRPCTQHWKIH